jgi:hypothetical protein
VIQYSPVSVSWSLVLANLESVSWIDLREGQSLFLINDGSSRAFQKVELAPLSQRICGFTASPKGVTVDPVISAVTLNGVVVSKRTPLRNGDRVSYKDTSALLVAAPSPVLLPERIADIDDLLLRLHHEFARAPGKEICVLSLSFPSLNVNAKQVVVQRVSQVLARNGLVAAWGQLARDVTVAILGPLDSGLREGALTECKEVVSEKVKVRLHTGDESADRLQLEIWKSIFDHPLELDSSVFVSPVLIGLKSLLLQIPADVSVALMGEDGTGRQTLAKELLDDRGVVLPPLRSELLRGKKKICVTTMTRETAEFGAAIPVPPLRSRPQDIDELAAQYVLLASQVLRRSKLSLSAQVKAIFRSWPWPGNVTELKNVIFRAAHMTASDEVGLDALPKRMLTEAPSKDLRTTVKEAEKEVLLNMLARTKWNVSVAASRLGLPRRTVVYRIARLGLKRPAK